MNMRVMGLVLLCVGSALAAAYGARLSPEMRELVTREGRAALAQGEPGPEVAIPGPAVRLSSWASTSGPMFFVGLVLITTGAILGRKGLAREVAEQSAAAGQGAGAPGRPVDFGAALAHLTQEVGALSQEVDAALAQGGTQLDGLALRTRARIEAWQLDAIDPMVEARQRLQVRFGVAGYAELFGPFSAAERRLARAWTALADGHWPEAQDSLRRAAADLEDTRTILDRLTAG